MMTQPAVFRAGAALFAVLAATACTDRSATEPSRRAPAPLPPLTPGTSIAALTCTAMVQAGTVVCAPPTPSAGTAEGIIVGSQGVYVQLTSTNVSYNPGTGQFTFDATLQNLLEQPLGTTDGGTPDPGGINIFFHVPPTVVTGTGSVAVVPDGFGTFLAAAQPYYNYPYLLQQTDVSPAETWTFIVPPTVTSFTFGVYVSAPVEYPTGYITLNGELPGASYGPLHPGLPVGLAAVVKNAVGATLPGAVVFATTDPDCASVNGTGTVTGVRAASCAITATSGAFAGEMLFDVTGTQRTWNGSVSPDWAVGGNWDGGYAPAAVDSAVIPTGVPAFPALSAAVAIGGVSVADGATLSLGAFDLTASASVATGPTAGSGILGTSGVLRLAGAGQTVRGRVPSLAVTGTYALDDDLHVVAPGRVLAGEVRNAGFQLRAAAQ